MGKIYVIAKSDGTSPSMPQKGEVWAKKALATCRKGWPEYPWLSFELDHTPSQNGVWSRATISLRSIRDEQVKMNLFDGLTALYSGTYQFEV